MGLTFGTSSLHLFFNWFAIATTFPLVLTRLYTRIVTQSGWRSLFHAKSWSSSDLLVVVAWLLTLPRGIEHTISVRWYKYAHNGILPLDIQIRLAKLQYVCMAIYWLPLYTVKIAILAMYNEFSPPWWRKKWWSPITVTMVVCIVGCLATLLIYLFGCHPLSIRWTPKSRELIKCMRDRFILFYVLMEVFHILTDLVIFIIPFYILHIIRHTITSRQKVMGNFMFALGLCSLLSSVTMSVLNLHNGAKIVRPVIAIEPTPEILLYNYMVFLEHTSALIVVCIPNLRRCMHVRNHRFSSDRSVSELDVERNSQSRISHSDPSLDTAMGQRPFSPSNTLSERPISLKAIHVQRAWSEARASSSTERVEI